MAKKKNQNKKHRFKYTDPSSVGASLSTPSVSGGVVNTTAAASVSGSASVAGSDSRASRSGSVVARDFSYVGHDLRRVAIFAASLVALELVLWYIFSHTGVGAAVYKLVKF